MLFKILVFEYPCDVSFADVDAETLDVHELCQITGANGVNVKRAILFWVVHGVLKEISPDTFYVLEHAEETSSNQGNTLDTFFASPQHTSYLTNSNSGNDLSNGLSPIKRPIHSRTSRIRNANILVHISLS